MGAVTRIESGFLFSDDFNNVGVSSYWSIFPYDLARVQQADNSLILKHGMEPINLTLPMLTSEPECVLDIRNAYIPTCVGDVGGITVIGDTDNSISIEEYYDTETNTVHSYPWLRLVRKYNNYSAYWSDDGTVWNILGSSYFNNESPSIGVFLGGENGADYKLLQARAFKSTKITVNNLTPGMQVSLLSEGGEVLRTSTCIKFRDNVEIDVTDLGIPLVGKFQISMLDGTSYTDDTVYSIYGGDSYRFNLSPLLYFESLDTDTGISEFKPLAPNIEEFLGYFGSDRGSLVEIRMKIVNPFIGTFTNITISIVEYLTNYHEANVFLSNDVGGAIGTLCKTLDIEPLGYNSESYFWIQANRGNITLQQSNQLTFGLDVIANFE